jgi:deazaflavin-dependent oxidoreductase (nitroreductase family)
VSDWNQQVIEEFRANGGKVAQFGEVDMVILHTKGAKSGQERETPLMTRLDLVEGAAVIFASAAGATKHPAWFHNVVADPHVRIEIGDETRDVVARVAEGEERERIWSQQKADIAQFAEYEKTTEGRTIPVIVLEPAS